MLSRSLRHNITLIWILFALELFGQRIEVFELPSQLSEVSGIEQLDDSTLIAINDSGNTPTLFLLNMDGSLRRSVEIKGTINNDWEDLARDEDHIYIADIGNNFNNRQNQKILKVRISDILLNARVNAEEINIKYFEQNEFPPSKDSLYFDAESIAVLGDSIILVTKNRITPWNGLAFVYSISKIPGNYTLKANRRIDIGNKGWRVDSATGMDIFKEGWYILTYGKIQKYRFNENALTIEHTFKFRKFTQKEAVVVTEDFIFVADERNKLLGGGKLYRINP